MVRRQTLQSCQRGAVITQGTFHINTVCRMGRSISNLLHATFARPLCTVLQVQALQHLRGRNTSRHKPWHTSNESKEKPNDLTHKHLSKCKC